MEFNPAVKCSAAWLFRQIPLDNNYLNTFTFTDRTAQANFFTSLGSPYLIDRFPKTFDMQSKGSGLSVVRGSTDSVCLEINIADTYDANYIVFYNPGFHNAQYPNGKYFYAFVTGTEYVNNNNTRINFEIDQVQTWLFDFRFGDSVIEREHVADDRFGRNIIDEDIDTGELINDIEVPFIDVYTQKRVLADMSICVLFIPSDRFHEGIDKEPGYGFMNEAGYPSLFGRQYFPANLEGLQAANKWIGYWDVHQEQILSVTLVPSVTDPAKYARADGSVIQAIPTFSTAQTVPTTIKEYTGFDSPSDPSNYEVYYPHNKKLLTSPYQFLVVSTHNGMADNYRYEYFLNSRDSKEFYFDMAIECSADPTFILEPQKYAGAYNRDRAMILTGFPQLPWFGDVYKAWDAQHRHDLTMNVLKTVPERSAALGKAIAGLIAGGVSTKVAAMGVGGAKDLGHYARSDLNGIIDWKKNREMIPQSMKGTMSSTILALQGDMDFWFCNRHVSIEYAKRIDEYFDRYGYRVDRIGVPQMTSRPKWNFVKTAQANILSGYSTGWNGLLVGPVTGGCPSDAIEDLKAIFNAGITLWHCDGSTMPEVGKLKWKDNMAPVREE